jgi:hypothetical protein
VAKGVIPAAQHHAIRKLGRTTNPIGAIPYFICHYNLTRATV